MSDERPQLNRIAGFQPVGLNGTSYDLFGGPVSLWASAIVQGWVTRLKTSESVSLLTIAQFARTRNFYFTSRKVWSNIGWVSFSEKSCFGKSWHCWSCAWSMETYGCCGFHSGRRGSSCRGGVATRTKKIVETIGELVFDAKVCVPKKTCRLRALWWDVESSLAVWLYDLWLFVRVIITNWFTNLLLWR